MAGGGGDGALDGLPLLLERLVVVVCVWGVSWESPPNK